MIVVSGCPRSGTSLMMDLMRVTFGEDRIVGDKFPQETQRPEPKNEKAGRKSLRKWRKATQDKIRSGNRNFKEMNPNGFWECDYSVRGIRFDPRKPAPSEDKIVKIVSQGLAQSDPKYIDKVVFMLRHPRAVAKSQENLGRPGFNDSGDPKRDGKEQKVHTAEMFTNVTVAVAWWLNKFDVPYITVEFDDLIEDPETQLKRVANFLEEGNFSEAVGQVNPKLRRSIPQEREGYEWDVADKLYELMLAENLDEVETYAKTESERERPVKELNCPRMGRTITIEECWLCRTEPNTLKNFILVASGKDICWEEAPCAYDCIIEDITTEDSISNNHWAGIFTEKQLEGARSKEQACSFRGEATKTVPCCGGKTRPIEYTCLSKDTQDTIGAQMCNSKMCKFYK